MNKRLRLLIAILLPVATGILAGLFTASSVKGWYLTLNKPAWNPPSAVFAPVWTTLYILMGIAFYLIWQSPVSASQKKPAILFWSGQLVLNALWSFLFFKKNAIGFALIEISILWIVILITIVLFARISRPAAWLLVPYISWVSFAAILNYAIWKLNT